MISASKLIVLEVLHKKRTVCHFSIVTERTFLTFVVFHRYNTPLPLYFPEQCLSPSTALPIARHIAVEAIRIPIPVWLQETNNKISVSSRSEKDTEVYLPNVASVSVKSSLS